MKCLFCQRRLAHKNIECNCCDLLETFPRSSYQHMGCQACQVDYTVQDGKIIKYFFFFKIADKHYAAAIDVVKPPHFYLLDVASVMELVSLYEQPPNLTPSNIAQKCHTILLMS